MKKLEAMGMSLADVPKGTPERPLYCSFCGRRHDQVLVLVAGPTVFICDECVSLCTEVVEMKKAEASAVTIDQKPE